MADKISAGEAYVSISCNDKEFLKKLQDVVKKISDAAANCPDITQSVELRGDKDFKNSLRDIREELERTSNSGKSFADRFVVSFGDVVRAATETGKRVANLLGGLGDQFDKMSGRTGLSSSTLSEYGHAAQMCGADVSAVEGAVRSFQAKLGDANAGNERAAKAFDRLGVSFVSLSQLSPEQQFEKVASAIASIKDPTERASAAMKLLGGDGQRLLPMFNEGANGIERLRKEARELGVSIDSESARMGAEFLDSITRLKTACTGLGLAIAKRLTPIVTLAANALAEMTGAASRFANAHPFLTRMALSLATVVAGLLAAARATASLTAALNTLKAAATALKVGGLLTLPSVATIAAVTLGVATLATAFEKLRTARSGQEYSEDARNALDSGDSGRSEDRGAFGRLKELRQISREHKLTNDQIQEAVRLAGELRAKYGDVGIEVDKMTGKIKIAADAQGKLNAQMLQAQKADLEAAIQEARNNSFGDAIERKIADEQLKTSDWRMIFGWRKGDNFVDWLKTNNPFNSETWELFGDDVGLKKAILENDPAYKSAVAVAKSKEAANLQGLQARLAAVEAALSQPVDSTDFDAIQQGENLVADFIAQASEEESNAVDKRIAAINKKREELVDALRRLADPNGEVDWNDAGQVERLYNSSATFRALYSQFEKIHAAADEQISKVLDEEERKRAENLAKREEDASKKLAEMDKRRAAEGQDAHQRALAAIDDETNAYVEQLEVLKAIAEERGDVARVSALDAEIQKTRNDGEGRKTKATNDLVAEKWEKNFERFATPLEKLARASQELQTAYYELAQMSELEAVGERKYSELDWAKAAEKYGDALTKYEALADSVEGIRQGIGKSVGGTFSAWQAAAISSQSWDQKLYSETRTQTAYLREIARNSGRTVGVFG